MTYVFVGCSSEVVDQAEALSGLLSDKLGGHAKVEVWHQPGVMEAGSVLIQELERKAEEADFGMFLVTRNAEGGVSANVLFEMGLFIGALERYRTIIVRAVDAPLPTDLGGVLVQDASGLDRGHLDDIDELATGIAEHIAQRGERVRGEMEVGALEWMLNMCTPGYQDRVTARVKSLNPRSDGSEQFKSAEDFHDLCRCLLHRYVIGSMTPDERRNLRVYFAAYLGDGVVIERDGVRRPLDRFAPTDTDDPDARCTFVVAISNPLVERDSEPGAESPEGTFLSGNWRVGMPIPGYHDGTGRSTCARAFKDRREHRARRSDEYNAPVDEEAEMMAIPVLWNEEPHSASIGVLAVSSANEELMTTYEPCVQRLQLVANVLGIAAAQLSRSLEAPGDDFVGIDVSADQDHRSFTRRAVAVRRAIADEVIRDLLNRRAVSIEAVGDEFVLVREQSAA
jgi:hypothetical protein